MKIFKKVKFSKNQNRMKVVGNVEEALSYFKTKKNKNLYFLAKKRYDIVINLYQYFLLLYINLEQPLLIN